jgi:hypothetical protein
MVSGQCRSRQQDSVESHTADLYRSVQITRAAVADVAQAHCRLDRCNRGNKAVQTGSYLEEKADRIGRYLDHKNNPNERNLADKASQNGRYLDHENIKLKKPWK